MLSRSTLSCGGTITSVTVGVYDTSGSMKIGKTTDPDTTTYDLKSLDTSIKFSTLPAGGKNITFILYIGDLVDAVGNGSAGTEDHESFVD